MKTLLKKALAHYKRASKMEEKEAGNYLKGKDLWFGICAYGVHALRHTYKCPTMRSLEKWVDEVGGMDEYGHGPWLTGSSIGGAYMNGKLHSNIEERIKLIEEKLKEL